MTCRGSVPHNPCSQDILALSSVAKPLCKTIPTVGIDNRSASEVQPGDESGEILDESIDLVMMLAMNPMFSKGSYAGLQAALVRTDRLTLSRPIVVARTASD